MTKAKGRLLVCAEGVSIDKQSNNATIFSMIEQLNFKSLPVVYPKLVVFMLLEKDGGNGEQWDGELSISMDGSEIGGKPPITVDFQGKRRARSIVTIGGLPITQAGKMEVSLYAKGDTSTKILSYEIQITLPTEPIVT